MVVHAVLASTYARNVYMLGGKKLVDVPVSPDDYRTAVVKHAAINYTEEDLNYSLKKGHITQEEYDETMAVKAELAAN